MLVAKWIWKYTWWYAIYYRGEELSRLHNIFMTLPAALAASDLNGLFLVATRPSRRQATATTTAAPRHGQKGRGRCDGGGCEYGKYLSF